MPEALYVFDQWLLKSTLAGGVVLLIGTLWMAFTRQPVQRQRIGEFALLAALLVAIPAALPSWWSLPGTSANSATNKALFGQPLSSNRIPSATDNQMQLAVNNDDNEGDELNEALESIISLYTLKIEEKDENDSARIVMPNDNASDANCTKGSMVTFWGQWILRIIGFTYLTLVFVLLVRCSIGYYGLWRFWRQRRPAPAHVHTALAELEPDPAHRPRIGVNSLVHGPVSYGLWKPTILLPPAFCNEGDPEKLRWILAHELTHLRRRDAWGCLLLALGGALYFHVPWFWWMKRHVRLAQEYLADAAAAQIANAVEYAQYLLSLTTLTSRPTLASSQAAGVFESPSDLYRRVHMLLHQRNVLERGAPRWWTLTAAASFLTLAACTAGVQLYADEPPNAEKIKVTVVAGEDSGTEKKKTETKTITVNGKAVKGDGQTFVFTTDDNQANPHVIKVQGTASPDKQKAVEEALKKIDRMLEKSSKTLDDSTRTQLEELKKTLKTLNDQNKVVWQGQFDAAQDAQGLARIKFLEAARNSDEQVKAARIKAEVARKLAESHRDNAIVAEKLARDAQEKALMRWKEAKDGKDKDAAIKELEKAIAEKERALKVLKSGEEKAVKVVRGYEVVPPVATKNVVGSTGKGRLGVVTAEIDSNLRGHLDLADGQGLMLNEVIDPSPAWNLGNGLRSSDILIEFAGKKVPSDTEKFREMIGKLDAGTYSAVVFRKGKKLTIGGIKLPAAEKAKSVVLEGKLMDPIHHGIIELVNPVKDGDHLILKHKDIELADKINLQIKPQVLVTGEKLPIVDANQAKEHALLLELANADIAVGDVVKARPFMDTVKLDNVKIAPDAVAPFQVHGQGQKNEQFKIGPNNVTIHTAPVEARFVATQDQGSAKPRLGVTLEEVPDVVAAQIELPEDRGLFVREVAEGSAAQKAGILKNDILIEFADKPVSKDHDAFSKRVKELKPGKYTATVIRKGKEIRIRDINLADNKAVTEEKKAKAKEWVVEGDSEKAKEEENAKPRARAKKEKDDFFPNANGGINFVRGNGSTSIQINGDQFNAVQSNNGTTITIFGKMVNGKPEPKSIKIKNDDGEKTYKTIKDVPEEERAAIEKMLSGFKGNIFQWNGNNNLFLNQGQLDKQLEGQLKLFEKSMKQLGEGNPGFEQMERELERLREQLKKIRGIKEDEDK